jgi:cytochrome P450
MAETDKPHSMTPNPEAAEQGINLFTPEAARCPQPVYAEMRAKCPVTRMLLTNSPVIARFDDVVWALRHPEVFSSEMEMQIALGTERPMIPQQIDPPAQTRYRKLLDPCFSRKRMSELVPGIRRQANALIDGFIEAGECEFDSAFAIPLPCGAFLDLMGLPYSDLNLFLELKDGIIRPDVPLGEDPTPVRAASGKRIYEYFEKALDERQDSPGDDMLGYILTAEIKGDKLSREEMLDICFLLLLAGLDTVTATLGCNMTYLAENPDQRQRLIEDPSRIEAAVEELLRWETPVTAVPRVLKKDIEMRGLQMKQGELVTLLLGAANTDDLEFDAAQTVDFERPSNRHIAFGAGAHRCLGSHLARMELMVAMEEWHRRIPQYRIKEGEVPRFSPGIREAQYLPLVW